MMHRWGSACPGSVVVVLSTILLAAWVRLADAQEFGDTAAGRRLAETWCSSCHLIGASPGGAVSNGAPTFMAIAGLKSTTVLSLRAFLQTPHAQMPDLHLSRDEIDDLAGYILSLRSK
jgi:mono/diheme cytochrome c family protein